MSGARTRRQAALAAAAAADETSTATTNDSPAPEPAAEQKILTNGNGEAHGAATETTGASGPHENIFLFVPNLIGMPALLPGHSSDRTASSRQNSSNPQIHTAI